ncbi:uncharacterized protein LOC122250019 [Penaeus japonicus]|uniref:uncharacterized protein LOC122250019 n=1 Tax=Penaeus japonicus TaxID=27405 RepID=UPI001C71516D|nr:uncharacterized protein LOC122250019 [Penaeus japonicus]
MFATVITGLVFFAVAQASSPLLVAQVSNATIHNDTSTPVNTHDVLPTTPQLSVAGAERSTSRVKEANQSDVTEVVPPLSSQGISVPESSWIATDPSPLGEPGVDALADESYFATRSALASEEGFSTTWDPDVTTDVLTTASGETTTETTTEGVVERVSIRGTVVNCFCDVDEVLVDGVCQPYPEGTMVHMRLSMNDFRIALSPMAERRGIIKDLECDTENGVRLLTFSRGQFRLRDRGDIVLLEEAGELGGLRAGNYCISHFLDEHSELSWTVKVCVEPPNVPRCCPPGQAMKNNVCHPARTPEPLAPPISADPYGPGISWPIIKTYEMPLHCIEEPMKDLPLIPRVSYLAAHTEGLVHIWNSEETDHKFQYRFDHKYCVDGRQNLDGSASYSVKVCFESPTEQHQRLCDQNVCVRKCCKTGEIMDSYLYRCVPSPAAEFAPLMNAKYNLVMGQPLCDPYTPIDSDFSLSPDTGYLATWNITLPPSDYCIDKFSDREGRISDGALACISLFSTWEKAQNIVFPVCMIISLVFLLLIVVCYCAAPILLKNTGWYHLCHVVSLITAYMSAVMLQFLNSVLQPTSCIAFAIIMQFGYLAAFFWLSVLCFDVWRLFRSLNDKLRPPRPIPPFVYHLYAWSGPLIISSVTLVLQYVDADDIPWLIKPHLGQYKCWFGADMEQLVFFYLYIAILLSANCLFIGHTYWVKRKMDKSLAALRSDRSGAKPAADVTRRKRNYYSEFKTKFLLLALMSSCWVAEVLSWQIPPAELWALTDIFNTLQGFFIFVIFMQDRYKRQHLKEKFPSLFRIFKNIFLTLSKVKNLLKCGPCSAGTFSPYTYISTLNRKLSSSSIVSNLSTLSSSIKITSTSIFKVDSNKRSPQRSVSLDDDNGIITISHTPISHTDSETSITSGSNDTCISHC